MKDKLVRYGHKKPYYIIKKCVIGCSIVVASSVLIALPLSYGVNKVKQQEKLEIVAETNSEDDTLTF